MPENRYVLVLHFAGASEPMLIEIDETTAGELPDELESTLRAGQVQPVVAANETRIIVNFAHVVAAHVDTAPPLGRLYGSPQRRAG